MKVRVKRLLDNATIPKYANPGDACLDLYAAKISYTREGISCDTGVAIEIPDGYVGLVFPRSSISKTNLTLRNCVGVIDSGYRGSIQLKFRNWKNREEKQYRGHYSEGDRVGQIMIIPRPFIELEEVNELSDSHRGSAGFGSTGN